MTISPAATIVLTRAAERPDHRLEFHRKLPTGGRHKMIDALLRDGMTAETLGDYRLGEGSTLIENSATGLMLTTLRITDAGLAAVAHEVGTATAAPNANTAPMAATDAAAARGRSPAPPTPLTPPPWRPQRGCRLASRCARPHERCWPPGTARRTARPI